MIMRDALTGIGLRFAVIGAQRAGSTFSADALTQCPSIDLPTLELPIFEDPWWHRDVDRRQLLRPFKADTTLLRGIKRPDLLGNPDLAPRLLQAGVSHCVVIVRDPVKRMVSAAQWYVYMGRVPVPRSLDAYLESVANRYASNAPMHPFERQLVDYSRYGHLVSRWMTEFERRIIVASSPGVAADPGAFVDRVLIDCGLLPAGRAPDVLPQPGRRNAAPTMSQLSARILRSRLRFARSWDNTDAFRLSKNGQRIRSTPLHRAAVGVIYGMERMLSPVTRRRHLTVSDSTLDRLRELFDADVRRFTELSPECAIAAQQW